ncbi:MULTISPECIES: hypothetical protein [Niastella]|uniref:Lycopene cyclase domain-containing protein n=1 Tax=Niastella soli TaxID=2821487 RepID=A0ABS3Z093_9BACT|nr:hypothetical protein [Niastella soli]MBO9203187.1 hypothetical protein [Niastella soli]
MLNWFLDKIITGYVYSTIIFLLLLLVSQKARNHRTGFLNISNTLILAVLLGNLVYSFFTDTLFFILCTVLLGFLFQLCFIIKKFRIKIAATIVSVLLLLILTNIETVFVFITSFYKDYLPSSWSTFYYSNLNKYSSLGFTALYFVICWAFPQRKTN